MINTKPSSLYNNDRNRDSHDGRDDDEDESKDFLLKCCETNLTFRRELCDFPKDGVVTGEDTDTNSRTGKTIGTLHGNSFLLMIPYVFKTSSILKSALNWARRGCQE
jgi:hypothetical protein